MEEIEKNRAAIEAIDRQIVQLLNERYAHVLRIGERKKALRLPARVPEREVELMNKILTWNRGGLVPGATMKTIYRAIIDGAVAVEEHLPEQ